MASRHLEHTKPSSGERAEATLKAIGDAVLSTDLSGRITYLNPVAESMTGWTSQEASGRPVADVFRIIDRDTRETARDPLDLAIKLEQTVGLTANCVLIRRDGHEAAIEDSASPIRDQAGRVTGAVIVFRCVGAALEMSREMAHRAQHDQLTGLPNRMLLYDRLAEAIALGHRRNKQLAVCFLDVDEFKQANDVLGHSAGDELLQSIAERLKGALRGSDTVSRHGGDEFVVILTEIEHAADAALVADKLVRAIAEPHAIGRHDVRVTATIGIAIYPDHGHDASALIAHADRAMYYARRAGPGRCQVFDGHMVGFAAEQTT